MLDPISNHGIPLDTDPRNFIPPKNSTNTMSIQNTARLVAGALFIVANSVPVSAAETSPEQIPIHAFGWNPQAGWGAARLNDPDSESGATGYAYPETKGKVRLYLIDSAVDNSSGWFDGNPRLNFVDTGSATAYDGNPVAYDHGTKILSIIAGPGAGIAPKTPIEVVHFNTTPGGEGSTGSLLDFIDAIWSAVDYQAEHPDLPAVMCIAGGSDPGIISFVLQGLILDAVATYDMPVVVAAGNHGVDASLVVPAAYGTNEGVICVGASRSDNSKLSYSNYGPAVDVYAPGSNILAFDYVHPELGQSYLMNGTSPATAIVAAAAIIQLSNDPTLSAAEVEAAIKAESTAAGTLPLLLQVPAPTDIDYDGIGNDLEFFFGTDPFSSSSLPKGLSLSRSGNQSTVRFSAISSLIDASHPMQLANGGSWAVETLDQSTGQWVAVAPSSVIATFGANGKTDVVVTVDDSRTWGSYRLNVDLGY